MTEATMSDRTPQLFTLEELWLLHAKVRHEMAHQADWHDPPASLELNEAITVAILFCEELGQSEACVELSLRDCLVLDFVVPQEAKDVQGNAIGKSILRKSFRARARLTGHEIPATAEEPFESQVDVPIMMDAFQAREKGRKAV